MFKNGSIYEYEKFDQQTYETFAKEDKKGSFLNAVIKKKYKGQRIA